MYTIEKSFEFDYAHRVWNQELQEKFSCDKELKCRHLHGHHGVISVKLEASSLDRGDMVTDFKHLNWFKEFVNNMLDHKTILDIKDPVAQRLFPELTSTFQQPLQDDHFLFFEFACQEKASIDYELVGGLVFINHIPTSENFARILCKMIVNKMKDFFNIERVTVTFSETPQSKATFTQSLCQKS